MSEHWRGPLARLCGLENEYVARTSPKPGHVAPTTKIVFRALAVALQERVAAVRGGGVEDASESWFLENGGRVYLERIVEDWGLVECATPECRGPAEGVLFQAAQERMLIDLVPALETDLADSGYPCEVRFIRNAKDADGNLYGPQESYDVDVASGFTLLLYRLSLLPILCASVALLVFGFLFLASVAAVRVGAALAAVVVDRVLKTRWHRRVEDRVQRITRYLHRNARRLSVRLTKPVFGAIIAATSLGERLMHRGAVRALLPFLATRPIVCGTGSLDKDGNFQLSERAASVDRISMSLWFDLSSTLRQMRVIEDGDDRDASPRASRGLVKTKALMSAAMHVLELDLGPWKRLFRCRQRLELTSSDANRAQVAELVKLGSTMLVIDMHEAGALRGAPRVKDPVAVLKQVSADVSLTSTIACTDGVHRTALEIQRWYCDRAAAWLKESPTTSLEAMRVVELWTTILDGLAKDPLSLVGVIDWPTKKMLLDTAGKDLDIEARRKIDIRYHELGGGYFERFVDAGLARTIVDAASVELAIRNAPADTPAALRGRLIKDAKANPILDVGWEHVVMRDRGTGKKKLVLLRGGKD